MRTQQQVRQHRADLAVLTGLAQNDLRTMFVGLGTPDGARDALLDFLPALVAMYGAAAATLAADWYDDLRAAAGAAGRFTAIPADFPDRGRTDSLARWAVSPLYQAVPDFPTTLVKVSGGAQRIIANVARETVRVSSVQDRAAKGWVRVGTGNCDFCRSLLNGHIVHTEHAASFDSHDHCACTAAPAFV